MNQLNMIYLHLKAEGPITALQASKRYGIGRLAPRIHELRKMGYEVSGNMVKVKKAKGGAACVKEYRLA